MAIFLRGPFELFIASPSGKPIPFTKNMDMAYLSEDQANIAHHEMEEPNPKHKKKVDLAQSIRVLHQRPWRRFDRNAE